EALAARQEEQREVLSLAAGLVKPGGQLCYVTCSVLPEENGDQASWFKDTHPEFTALAYREAWRAAIGSDPAASADGSEDTLLLTPGSHGTDGFFIALFSKTTEGARE